MRVLVATTIAALTLAATSAAAQPSTAKPTIDNGSIDRAELAALGRTAEGPAANRVDNRQLLLTAVDPASTWHKLGLRTGDTVVSVDGSVADWPIALAAEAGIAASSQSVIYIEVIRKKKPLLIRRVITGDAAPAAGGLGVSTLSLDTDPDLAAELDKLIVAKDATTWSVDVDALLADPMRFSKGARVMPSTKSGKPNGFKLYAVRPSSMWARLGFQNGDTVTSVNGLDVSTPDKGLEVYAKLRDADKITVEIIRRGKPVTQTYVRLKKP